MCCGERVNFAGAGAAQDARDGGDGRARGDHVVDEPHPGGCATARDEGAHDVAVAREAGEPGLSGCVA